MQHMYALESPRPGEDWKPEKKYLPARIEIIEIMGILATPPKANPPQK